MSTKGFSKNSFPRYDEIQSELEGLSREKQYELLLTTYEWQMFREKVLKNDGNRCTSCNVEQGQGCTEMPFDQWIVLYDQVEAHNRQARKFSKENPAEFLAQLTSGNIDSVQLPYPSRIILGEDVILQVHHKLYFFYYLPWEYDFKFVTTLCKACHEKVHAESVIYTYEDESLSMRFVPVGCSKCGGTGYIEEYKHVQHGVCFDCGGKGVFEPLVPKWERHI